MIRHCDGECGKHDCYVGFLEARLTEVERERDEARAEAAMLKDECASISAEFGLPPTIRPSEGEIRRMLDGWKEARSEVERLRTALRTVAERQREADIDHCYVWLGHANVGVPLDQFMRETPLVTEAQIFVEQTDKK